MYDDYCRSLGLFVEKVVAPLLYSGEGEEVGEVVYQRNPTLRVQMPGFDALGHRHNDYMYKRQPTETNVRPHVHDGVPPLDPPSPLRTWFIDVVSLPSCLLYLVKKRP